MFDGTRGMQCEQTRHLRVANAALWSHHRCSLQQLLLLLLRLKLLMLVLDVVWWLCSAIGVYMYVQHGRTGE